MKLQHPGKYFYFFFLDHLKKNSQKLTLGNENVKYIMSFNKQITISIDENSMRKNF